MTPVRTPARPKVPVPEPLPPLQSGDRLNRDEFERRYDTMPELKKAELIEGVVYVGSPVTHRYHSNPHFGFTGWLSRYVDATPGVEGGDNGSVKLDLKNEPQPDNYLIILPNSGGQVCLDEDGYIVGAPEWVGEVAASTASYDLHDKLEAYRKNQVKEYVVWRVHDRAIDWFIRHGDQFEKLLPGSDGLYRSEIFPGLWLDPVGMIAGDRQAVVKAVEAGIASAEHAAFVAKLKG